jgi:hypothetical protein
LKKNKNSGFDEVFSALRKILARYPSDFSPKFDTPDNFYLESRSVVWNGKPLFFGAVQIKKNYVSFHLMPVYTCPELLNGLSPELKKRMQGKACFNFKETDKALFVELAKLTAAGRERWTSQEFLRSLAEKTSHAKA